jgi:hypothetical protein
VEIRIHRRLRARRYGECRSRANQARGEQQPYELIYPA